jgi:hypothetical protein
LVQQQKSHEDLHPNPLGVKAFMASLKQKGHENQRPASLLSRAFVTPFKPDNLFSIGFLPTVTDYFIPTRSSFVK